MKAHLFHEGPIPPGYKYDFEESLFNQQKHRELQAVDGWCSFFILNIKHKEVRAAIHFHVAESAAKSPLRGPFGSFEFSKSLPASVLFKFISFIELALKNKGVRHIVIKNYPQLYFDQHAILIHMFLLNFKYSISNAEISSVLRVNDRNIREIFHRSERRKLDKALQAKLTFRQIPIDDLDNVYTFIQNCRSDKNYILSMTLESLRAAVSEFPEHYILFGVFDENKLVAASISILVKRKILYDFYHDHVASYDHLSPVALLVAEMYNYCNHKEIKMLDMGTSSVNGEPNFSLLHFKKFLGAKSTSKFTFVKNLD